MRLQTPLHGKRGWSSSENNNADENVNIKVESESSQLMNTSQAPVEEVDQYAGYEDISLERGDDFDLNNYIEKIGEGVNFGQFKCNICGHEGLKWNVLRHVESKHFPGTVAYSCDQCEGNFDTMTKYYRHRSRHHSNKK